MKIRVNKDGAELSLKMVTIDKKKASFSMPVGGPAYYVIDNNFIEPNYRFDIKLQTQKSYLNWNPGMPLPAVAIDIETADRFKVSGVGFSGAVPYSVDLTEVLNSLPFDDYSLMLSDSFVREVIFPNKKVKDINYLAFRCKNLETLNLSPLDLSECIFFNSLCSGCFILKDITFSQSFVIQPYSIINMFKDCTELEIIDLSMFDFSLVEISRGEGCFLNTPKLTTCYVRSSDDAAKLSSLEGTSATINFIVK